MYFYLLINFSLKFCNLQFHYLFDIRKNKEKSKLRITSISLVPFENDIVLLKKAVSFLLKQYTFTKSTIVLCKKTYF